MFFMEGQNSQIVPFFGAGQSRVAGKRKKMRPPASDKGQKGAKTKGRESKRLRPFFSAPKIVQESLATLCLACYNSIADM